MVIPTEFIFDSSVLSYRTFNMDVAVNAKITSVIVHQSYHPKIPGPSFCYHSVRNGLRGDLPVIELVKLKILSSSSIIEL